MKTPCGCYVNPGHACKHGQPGFTFAECPQCRGAGEYAYPGDGLRTTRCAKCSGRGFIPQIDNGG